MKSIFFCPLLFVRSQVEGGRETERELTLPNAKNLIETSTIIAVLTMTSKT